MILRPFYVLVARRRKVLGVRIKSACQTDDFFWPGKREGCLCSPAILSQSMFELHQLAFDCLSKGGKKSVWTRDVFANRCVDAWKIFAAVLILKKQGLWLELLDVFLIKKKKKNNLPVQHFVVPSLALMTLFVFIGCDRPKKFSRSYYDLVWMRPFFVRTCMTNFRVCQLWYYIIIGGCEYVSDTSNWV